MLIGWLVAVICGVIIGYLLAGMAPAPPIERWRQLDQRHYERWQAYVALEQLDDETRERPARIQGEKS